jgi:hypothetical protein
MNACTNEPRRPAAAARPRARGVVLMLVLSALVVAGILAYSILASAALDAQSSAHLRAAVEAESLAESGVNVAMHYLLQPQESPVALVQGLSGDWHYPGQGNVALGAGSFSVTVTNIAPAKYRIDASGRALDADGSTCERQLRVQVVGINEWKARGAGMFASALKMDPDMTINGDLLVHGNFEGGGVVTGVKRAANYVTGDPGWGPPPIAPELVVPPFSTLDLVQAVTQRSGYYVYGNTRGRVDYIFFSPVLLPPIASVGNPGKVFVYNGSAPLLLGGLAASNFTGTLVLTKADLVISQTWTFNPMPQMPALLVAGKTSLNGASGKVTVNGVYYAGNGFGSSTTTVPDPVTVDGAFLSATSSGSTYGSSMAGALLFNFNDEKADVPDLTDTGIRYGRLQIEDWELVN